MSAPKPDGGWAFPVPMDSYSNCKGMTLRDYFAAAALQGMLANFGTSISPESVYLDVLRCYEHADAMLEAREERQ